MKERRLPFLHPSPLIPKVSRPGGSATAGALLAPGAQCADCAPGGDSRVFEEDALLRRPERHAAPTLPKRLSKSRRPCLLAVREHDAPGARASHVKAIHTPPPREPRRAVSNPLCLSRLAPVARASRGAASGKRRGGAMFRSVTRCVTQVRVRVRAGRTCARFPGNAALHFHKALTPTPRVVKPASHGCEARFSLCHVR